MLRCRSRLRHSPSLRELARRGATVVSTDDATWSNVPYADTLRGVIVDEKKRLTIKRHPDGLYVDFLFKGTRA